MKNYTEFKKDFDKKFSILTKSKIRKNCRHSKDLLVNDSISYIQKISEGGKRLRPYLAYLSFKSFNKKNEDIFPLLAAIEYLHIFCLIHDDIMDKSEKRHSVETINNYFGKKNNDGHFGISIAILLGDLVFLWSQECIQDLDKKILLRDTIINEFHKMIDTVIYGQSLDIYLTKRKTVDVKLVNKKMELKSSSYTFYYPMILGVLSAGKNLNKNKNLSDLANSLGAGFQLKDDLLDIDIKSNSDKSLFLDTETSQHTILSWYLTSKSQKKFKNKFNTYFGKNKIEKKNYSELYNLFLESGAIDYCEDTIERHFTKAKSSLKKLGLENQMDWEDLIQMIQNRKK
jgi:geranylgeranyl diphosphate synthase type I